MILIADSEQYKDKEALYIQVRTAEGRVPDVEAIRALPYVAESSPLKAEWDNRANSYERLKKYLSAKGKPLHILDIGCGNGWMSHRLYEAGHSITGIELNLTELQQAEEAFGSNERLQWMYADILKSTIVNKYDIILLSASCQYFASLRALTARLIPMLSRKGEIHLHDSMFYTRDEIAAAQQRSLEYYTKLGYPGMADYYHHHSKEELLELGYHKKKPPLFARRGNKLEWWIKQG
jgi:SAM-dependent methyltransferase